MSNSLIDDLTTWEGLSAHLKRINPLVPYYIGDTREEFEALKALAVIGVLWEQKPCGPCGGCAITVAVPNPYAGAFPFMGDPDSKNTVGSEGEDTPLICAMHNKAMVKLYLSMKEAP